MNDRFPSKKPNLLVLASTYPRWVEDHEPGFVHELSRRLCQKFDVTVVTPHAPGAKTYEILDGVEVVRYRYALAPLETLVHEGGMAANIRRAPWKALLLPGFLFFQYLAAQRVLKRRRVAVVHAHWLIPQGIVARWLARRAGVPYVVTSHGGDLFGLKGKLFDRCKRSVANSSAAMTVVSSAMREEAMRIGLEAPTIEVLPMGVDLQDRFVAAPGLVRERDSLLFVGRLVPKKGLPHLLDAMPLVLSKRPSVVLRIVGFGPELPTLQAKARRLGIAESVEFLGAMPQRDLPMLYRKASVFVAPFVRDAAGDQEGLPVALMEAIGCGCPIVVGDVAGVQDLLGRARDAVCVDPRNAKALAAAILGILDAPELAAQRAVEIKQVTAGRVDWNRVSEEYARIIAGVIVAPASQ